MRLENVKPGTRIKVPSLGHVATVLSVGPGAVRVELAPVRREFETRWGERVSFNRPRRTYWTPALEVEVLE